MASPFCFRPSPELAERIDEGARGRGLKRSEWLTWAVERALDFPSLNLPYPSPVSDEEGSVRPGPPADGASRADAFRAASLRRLGR